MNRSHYEDVVIARLLGIVDDEQCERRFRHIREFERMLTDEGTSVVKVFLHISKDEQRARLQARIDDPEKNWKFRSSDLESRAQDAHQERTRTSSRPPPPTGRRGTLPADHKWVRIAGPSPGRRVRAPRLRS
jgi:polyphosphate kinase 2 (PPK2 family)